MGVMTPLARVERVPFCRTPRGLHGGDDGLTFRERHACLPRRSDDALKRFRAIHSPTGG